MWGCDVLIAIEPTIEELSMNIIEHTEKYLGKIAKGWKGSGFEDDLQVVFFQNSPFDNVNTFLTLGLSHHVLSISNSKKVRQELVLPVSGVKQSSLIVTILFYISELILKYHKSLLRGQVISLPLELSMECGYDAIYCAMPVFLNDTFSTFYESEPPTVMVWIIPIYQSESDFIAANGWERFEDLLEENDSDLFSCGRVAVI